MRLDSLTPCNSKGGQCQSSINLFRYRWIHLHAAKVKEDSVNHQSSIDIFKYRKIHLLQAAIAKEDNVSRQSRIDQFRIDMVGFTYNLQ
jgi:hypothetical protein